MSNRSFFLHHMYRPAAIPGAPPKRVIVDYIGGRQNPGARRKAALEGKPPLFDKIEVYGTRWIDRSRYPAPVARMIRSQTHTPQGERQECARRKRQMDTLAAKLAGTRPDGVHFIDHRNLERRET